MKKNHKFISYKCIIYETNIFFQAVAAWIKLEFHFYLRYFVQNFNVNY